MPYETILVETQGRVGIITSNRPERLRALLAETKGMFFPNTFTILHKQNITATKIVIDASLCDGCKACIKV